MDILKLWVLLALLGCSNMSKNVSDETVFYLDGGVAGPLHWRDDLAFKRISFYHEATLLIDILIAPINSTNPFFAWLSPGEQKIVNECPSAYVSLYYTASLGKIPETAFKEQMDKAQMRSFIIPEFRRNMKLHPDYGPQGFRQYSFSGFCNDSMKSSVDLNFPGYQTFLLSLPKL